jgi:hypothetical protein
MAIHNFPIVEIAGASKTTIDATYTLTQQAVVASEEVENHFHNYERWLGKLAVPAGGKVAEEATLTPFQAVSGNNTWGTPIQLIDVNDVPLQAGRVKFDPHRIVIVDASSATVYRMRLAIGDTYAAAIAAGHYTGMVFRVANVTRMTPMDIQIPDQLVGTKVWCAVWNATNSATVDFFIGLHEYLE